MTAKQVQTWLAQNNFYHGPIDGNITGKSKEALKQAQSYFTRLGLYNKKIDGKIGDGTFAAITNFDKGKRTLKHSGVTFNIHSQQSINAAFEELRKKGYQNITVNNHTISLADKNAAQNYFYTNHPHLRYADAQAAKKAKNAPNSFGSSFGMGDLNDLVMRYAFDKYHGVKTDDKQWGISYNYTPHTTSTGGFGITLNISNKYTPQQAQQIAIGAGMKNYKYNGKSYEVNLFDGKFRDVTNFENFIKKKARTEGIQAAQTYLNNELRRQYTKYGIDYNQLSDKTGFQWNNLFGVVPYGYNPAGIKSILTGNPVVQGGHNNRSGAISTRTPEYKYDPVTGKGRFEFNDYTGWRDARILARRGLHNGGISHIRAVTSTYAMGFPVISALRGQLQVIGANPNKDSVDFTNYYTLTDPNKGSKQMQAWVYNAVRKNPQAAFNYFKYIYGDRKRSGLFHTGDLESTQGRDFKIDRATADRLAAAAGLPRYHVDRPGIPFKDAGITNWNKVPGINLQNDVWGSLKNFYESAYDEKGNLKQDFRYAENGYDHKFDGGGYTVNIKNGNPVFAEDTWNIDLMGTEAGMNAGRTDRKTRGVPLINRFPVPKHQQGGLIKYITK